MVGISAGDIPQPTNPAPTDLSVAAGEQGGTTISDRWCYDVADSCGTDGTDLGLPGPINSEFDLDHTNVEFLPTANGFRVGKPPDLRLRCNDDSASDFDQQLILSPVGTNLSLEWSALAGQLGVRLFANGAELDQFVVPAFQWQVDTQMFESRRKTFNEVGGTGTGGEPHQLV